ncbi:biosynthetic-type acetolactate synthase large subunit [Candidatus Deianiraea vastatrix]|uniref:Acetolactate synthase n=1 Tax=Candidatus Deianiraea vastatrix TaxID=2163644 RepID=A0A5B8XEW8_9RICK|nr:biosynthetic-type acetolactate synthase large subunit [Candidatus Deianiraea vastatrix]QED22881.1 Acetolactate/acetohydroxybutanoate synthase large subunit [Candidatus Deianiraea vastatrix]
MNGAKILLKILKKHGVETVFGYPGGANLTLYDEIHQQSDIKHVLTCHEQAAMHAAQGFSRATGRLGVVFLTSGPGATNGVTGIADAMLDSTPILIITSQVPTYVIGSDAFQEADVIGITKPITKHNYLVKKVEDVAKIVSEAINIASTGRKGPVVVDIPKDVHAAIYSDYADVDYKIRDSYFVKTDISQEELMPAIDMILAAKKPIFYLGGGISASCDEVSENVTKLAHKTGFPVTTTLMGLGVFAGSDKQNLQMLGMHGSYEANMAMNNADLLIAIGVRFDDRVTGNLAKFSPNSKKIHIDIDPSEFNKNVKVDAAIRGDCGIAISKILKMLDGKTMQNLEPWWAEIENWRGRNCFGFDQKNDAEILPQYALSRVYELTKEKNPYFTTDVGQHQMWAAQYLKTSMPKHFITSAGLGTMGFGLPAAIGAQFAKPENAVICITGEGSFMMNMQELATIKRYNLPVKIVMLNNNFLGMVRQWQDEFYSNRHTEVDFTPICPDFIALCASFGICAKFVDKPSEVDAGICEMMSHNGAFLLVVRTKRDENVYPMIPPGAGHSEMLLG